MRRVALIRVPPSALNAVWAILAAVLAPMLASPAHAEVKHASPSGFTIEHARDVPVDASTAFAALVTQVNRWWPRDHTWWGADGILSIDPRAGGCFCERAGTREALHMLVTFVDPGRTLRMIGGLGPLQGMGLHGVLEFRLAPAGEGATRITMSYRAGGYSPEDLGAFAPVVDKVQGAQLGGLAELLGGKPVDPPK